MTRAGSVMLLAVVMCMASSCAAESPDFLAAYAKLPAAVKVVHLSIPSRYWSAQFAALMAEAQKEEGTLKASKGKSAPKEISVNMNLNFDLPQLYVYDAQGHQVFADTGYENGMRAFEQALTNAKPDLKAETIRVRLQGIDLATSLPALPPVSVHGYTLLEYWAPWCSACFMERDALLRYVRAHPQMVVRWITVDANMPGVSAPPAA